MSTDTVLHRIQNKHLKMLVLKGTFAHYALGIWVLSEFFKLTQYARGPLHSLLPLHGTHCFQVHGWLALSCYLSHLFGEVFLRYCH